MSSFSDELTKHRIFSDINLCMVQYIKIALQHYENYELFGDYLWKKFLNEQIVDKIATIISNNDFLDNTKKKFLYSIIYFTNITISTTELNIHNIAILLKQNLFSLTNFFSLHVQYCVSYYLNWDNRHVNMSIEILDYIPTHRLYRLIWRFTYGSENVDIILADIEISKKSHYQKDISIISIIENDINNILSKIYLRSDKDILRCHFFINMLIASYINYPYISKEDIKVLTEKRIIKLLIYFQKYIHKNNKLTNNQVPCFVIQRLDDNNFNIYFNKLIFTDPDSIENQVTEGINNLHSYYNIYILKNNYFLTYELYKNIDSKLYQHINSTYYKSYNLNVDINLEKILNDYINELVYLDEQYNKSVLSYTSEQYQSINEYIYKKIYGINNEVQTEKKISVMNTNTNIVKLIYHMSNKYNKNLFNEESPYIYVYRLDYNLLLRDISYYNLKSGDIIITPTITSTGISEPNYIKRDILFRIKLDANSKFLMIMKYSVYKNEKEIILPYGSLLKITNIQTIRKTDDQSDLSSKQTIKVIKLLDVEFIGTTNIIDVNEHVNYFINNYLSKKNIVMTTTVTDMTQLFNAKNDILHDRNKSTMNIETFTNVFFENVNILPYLPEIDIDNPYKNIILQKLDYAMLPDFNEEKAYLNEYIPMEKTFFCNKDTLSSQMFQGITDSNLNIMTFNVHNFVKVCAIPGRNVCHFLNFIENFLKYTHLDFLCLQEVGPIYDEQPNTQEELRKGTLRPLVDAMNKLGFIYYTIVNANYDENRVMGDYYISCNCIFSKIKPKKIVTYGLEDNRIAQVYEFSYNHIKLALINTHLEYNDDKNIPNSINKIISKQILQLYLITRYYEYSFILTGDLNHEILHNNIFHGLLDNRTSIITPYYKYEYDDHNTITSLKKDNIIDYIIISKKLIDLNILSLNKSEIIKSNISDHYPVFASLKYNFSIVYKNTSTTEINKLESSQINYTMSEEFIYQMIQQSKLKDGLIYVHFGYKSYNDNRFYHIVILPDTIYDSYYPIYLYFPIEPTEKYTIYAKKLGNVFKNISKFKDFTSFKIHFTLPYIENQKNHLAALKLKSNSYQII